MEGSTSIRYSQCQQCPGGAGRRSGLFMVTPLDRQARITSSSFARYVPAVKGVKPAYSWKEYVSVNSYRR